MKKVILFLVTVSITASLILAGCSSPAPAPSSTTAPSPAQPASPSTPSTPSTSAKTSPAPAPSTSASPAGAQASGKLPEKITYACHAVGTTVHAMVTALAKVESDYSGMLVVVQPTSGPAAWVPQMTGTGKPELGSSHSLDAWWAYSGKVSPVPIPGDMLGDKPFYQKSPNLRTLGSPARQGGATLVRQDLGIKSYADLKAKKYRIATGYVGQPSAYATLIADLINQGMTMNDFIPVIVSNSNEGVKALKEGRVDATNNAVGAAVIAEMDASVPVRFLSASNKPEDIQRVTNFFPGSTYAEWDPTYPGLLQKSVAFTYPVMMVTSTALPNDVAEVLMNVIWDHYKELQKLHPSFERFTSPEEMMLKQPSIPYHDGAVAFFKKKGLWNAEIEAYQTKLLNGETPFVK